MQELLEIHKNDLKSLCETLSVQRLYVFGSVVTDHFNADSDIDFLIAFKDNLSVDDYTDNYFLLHEGLRRLFRKEIDLVTERTLTNPYLIQSINESKRLMYEA